jgi:predicted nucleotidyltransferase
VNRQEGLRIARQVKELLLERGYPVSRVVLFGSVAKDTAHEQSDIDIAVVTKPFRESLMDERVDIHLASMDIDLRVETVTLRPEDFKRPFFTLAREIERTGVEV